MKRNTLWKTLPVALACACLMLVPAHLGAAEPEALVPEATTTPSADVPIVAPPMTTLEPPLETTEVKRGHFGAEDLSALLEESPECLAPEYEISYAGEGPTCPSCQFGTCNPNDPNACGGPGCGACVQFPTIARCLCFFQ